MKNKQHLLKKSKKTNLIIASLLSVTSFTVLADSDATDTHFSNELPNITLKINGQTGYEQSMLVLNNSQNTIADNINKWLKNEKERDFKVVTEGDLQLFMPLENKDTIVFLQGGVGHSLDHENTTLNIGLGSRKKFNDNYTLGGNLFYDYLMSGHHRISSGLELMTNYFTLSGNLYFATSRMSESDLKNKIKSKELNLDEFDADTFLKKASAKPALGFDMKAVGYLPFHPQFGAKLTFERSFSEEKNASISKYNMKSIEISPSRLTVGLNYTPVPAITFGAEYRKHWNNNEKNANFKQFFQQPEQHSADGFYGSLSLTYRLGRTPQSQFDFDAVDEMRQVAVSAYDPVERNNNVELQHTEDDVEKSYAVAVLSKLKNSNPELVIQGSQLLDKLESFVKKTN